MIWNILGVFVGLFNMWWSKRIKYSTLRKLSWFCGYMSYLFNIVDLGLLLMEGIL